MVVFDAVVELIESRGKKVDTELISNVIFDHTIQKILELKESSNTELQRNISNGNIDSFNAMIAKSLGEIVEFNITLSERKLRDSLLSTLAASGKMSEIQAFIETSKYANINKFMQAN